jgi:type IV fimbrial biogenesis protein FimT
MIGLAIFGFLFFAGLPSVTTWIQNSQIRTATESIASGLTLARGEAVKRNGTVEFVMTNTDPIAANVNAIVADAAGRNWVVRYFDTSLNPGAYVFVDGRWGKEGRGGGDGEESGATIAATESTFSFNGLGRTSLAAQVDVDITNPYGGSCAPEGDMRCLRVAVTPWGQVKMCDPAVGTGDSRAC